MQSKCYNKAPQDITQFINNNLPSLHINIEYSAMCINDYISYEFFSMYKIINIDIFYVIHSYEPELHPGVTYKLKEPKATLKIFSTGSVTVTGSYRLSNLFRAILRKLYSSVRQNGLLLYNNQTYTILQHLMSLRFKRQSNIFIH